MTASLSPQMYSNYFATSASLPGLCGMGSHAEEADFMAVADAFRTIGGIRMADEIAVDLRAACCGDVGQVARWIVNRQVVSVYWRGNYWVPGFQFSPSTVLLRPCVSAVLRELVPVLDDWDLCRWFAAPSDWLGRLSPAEALDSDPAEVFHAARAHRFVLSG